MLFFPYLEHVLGPLVFPSSALLILNLVEYLCAGWLLLRLLIAFFFLNIVIIVCDCGVYISILCIFDVECFENCIMFVLICICSGINLFVFVYL